jgi:hypothetical protein
VAGITAPLALRWKTWSVILRIFDLLRDLNVQHLAAFHPARQPATWGAPPMAAMVLPQAKVKRR